MLLITGQVVQCSVRFDCLHFVTCNELVALMSKSYENCLLLEINEKSLHGHHSLCYSIDRNPINLQNNKADWSIAKQFLHYG